MMDLGTKAVLLSVATVMAAVSLAGAANAGECGAYANRVVVTGSTAIKPLIAKLAPALQASSPPTTIVYKGQGSCTGVDAIVNGTKITGTASVWDASGVEQTCNLDFVGNAVDIGVSDVFSDSCPGMANVPTNVGDFSGPVQVMTFVVPKASSQSVISAQAAYLVWGFGQAGRVAPWTDENFLFRRNDQSGTQQMIGRAINVPANKWKGKDSGGSGALLASVASSMQPEATLGILASDVADGNRDKVKILAYQHYGQSAAYWPDSSPNAFDKANVRDGHYAIWGPLHLLTKVDPNGYPENPTASQFIGYFTGDGAAPAGVNLLDLEIAAHTVPACAMRVKRNTELGDVFPYESSAPCGCYFEYKAAGRTSCTACTSDASCSSSSPRCRHGFCEAK